MKIRKRFGVLVVFLLFSVFLFACQDDDRMITITFESNGGSSVEPITASAGEEIDEPEIPEKEGYTFIAWFTDEEITEKFVFSTMPKSDITLYAKWDQDGIDLAQIGQFGTTYTIPTGLNDNKTTTVSGGYLMATTETTYVKYASGRKQTGIIFRIREEKAKMERSVPHRRKTDLNRQQPSIGETLLSGAMPYPRCSIVTLSTGHQVETLFGIPGIRMRAWSMIRSRPNTTDTAYRHPMNGRWPRVGVTAMVRAPSCLTEDPGLQGVMPVEQPRITTIRLRPVWSRGMFPTPETIRIPSDRRPPMPWVSMI